MQSTTRYFNAAIPDDTLAVLFPLDMGNYGRNRLQPRSMFLALKRESSRVRFIGYHRRASGNFVFEQRHPANLDEAVVLVERISNLRCIARTFRDLAGVRAAVPGATRTPHGSVVVQMESCVARVIFVGVSEPIPSPLRVTGLIAPRVKVMAWVSAMDVVCLYERPKVGGDVGQVTGVILRALRREGGAASLTGTGRALSVVHDLLDGQYETA